MFCSQNPPYASAGQSKRHVSKLANVPEAGKYPTPPIVTIHRFMAVYDRVYGTE